MFAYILIHELRRQDIKPPACIYVRSNWFVKNYEKLKSK